jgi:tripartite-type tricarboxylate transporter receptor subunit TctC
MHRLRRFTRRNFMSFRQIAATTLAVGLALATVTPSLAQNYPDKAVSMVVPFGAGGSTDITARQVARAMQDAFGRSVVILNRPGAGGNIAAESVARAAPDGYTLLFGSTALAIAPAIYAKLRYDVLKDLTPVSQVTAAPNVLAIHPSVPIRLVKELVALAKSRPGRMTASFGGTGTANHLGLALFNSMTGVNITAVPYNNNAQAVTDVVSGYVDMTLVPIAVVVPLVQAGRLRALAVTTAARSHVMPEVPTVSEAGVKGYESSSWTGVLTTGGTPAEIVERIHAAVAASMKTAALKEALRNAGATPIGSTPAQFAQSLRNDVAKYRKVAASAGIKPE